MLKDKIQLTSAMLSLNYFIAMWYQVEVNIFNSSHPQHIPPGYLLPKWPLYFSTLNLYLMHPASTVRQATSVAFKYLGKIINLLKWIMTVKVAQVTLILRRKVLQFASFWR